MFLFGMGNITVHSATVLPVTSSSSPFQIDVIAKTSIEKTIVVFDKDSRKIKVDFDLIDSLKNQTSVNYSLTLSDSSGKEKTFIYNNDLYLPVNQSIHETVEETVPDYFTGKLNLLIKAQNSSGVILVASVHLNVINVPKTEASKLYIENNSCYLTVDSSSNKYTLYQGVDLSSAESLYINCKILNTDKNNLNLIPKFDSYERSIGGQIIDKKELDSILITSGDSLVKIKVPLPIKPQSYDSSFSLLNRAKSNLESNNVIFHYVIRGNSGTINMVSTDKTSYLQGETAKIEILWVPRADYFPNSRFDWKKASSTNSKILGELTITDQAGQLCTDPILFNPNANKEEKINLQALIKEDCNGFVTKIDVKDTDSAGKDTILVAGKFNNPKVITNSNDQRSITDLIFPAIIILLIIIVIFTILIRTRKVKLLIFIILFTVTGFIAFDLAKAYTLTLGFNWRDGHAIIIGYGDFSIQKVLSDGSTSVTNSFNVGDTMVVNDSKTQLYQRCGNGANTWVLSKMNIIDSSGNVFYTDNYTASQSCDSVIFGICTNSKEFFLTRAGTYNVNVTFQLRDSSGAGSFSSESTFTKTITVTGATDADIGLKVNQGTTAIPDIVNIAVEKNNGSTSPLRIAKDAVVHGVQLVSVSDPLATKVIINSPSTGLKALKKYSSSGSVNQPFGYWTFDESSGSAVADSSGNNLTGTTYNAGVVTALPRSAGVSGNAINFNGNYQYVVIPMSKNFVGGSITVSAWVKSLNYNGAMFIVSRGNVNGEWNLFFEGGLLKWRGASNSTYNYNFAQCTPPTTGEWHNIVATQINGTPNVATLYIDGNVCGTSNSVPPIMNNVGNIQIGAYDDIISTVGAHTYGYFFEGQMDNIRLYNEAKTAEEVREIYMAR